MTAGAGLHMGTRVALVDRDGNRIGDMEKLRAHEEGQLHEAFSVLVFNDRGELLLQQRAGKKYHSGGKWSNTCCSHPDPFDVRSLLEVARDRLDFEMGFACDLERIDAVCYREELSNGLVEHEYDHILVGHYSGEPSPNPNEVQDWLWVEPVRLAADLVSNTARYSAWLTHILGSGQLSRWL
jgi:isopentenyl-diphosphate delta-isomerase